MIFIDIISRKRILISKNMSLNSWRKKKDISIYKEDKFGFITRYVYGIVSVYVSKIS